MNPDTTFIDPLLTNVYIGYSNTELIADILFPKVEVIKESGIYFKNDKSNLIEPDSTKRALTGQANRVTGTLSQATYNLEEHTLEEYIDDRVMKNYDRPFAPRRNATNRIAGQLMIEKENQLITNLAASTSTASNGVDIAGAWDTASTDTRAQVLTGKDYVHKLTGVRPNTLVIDRVTYNGLLKNTDIKDSIANATDRTEAKIRNMLAGYYDVDQVLIAGGIKQSAATSGTGSFLWSTKGIAYLAYVNPAPAIEETSAGYQFFKGDMIGVDVRREEAQKSDVVRVTDYYEMNVVDSECLYVLEDTITT